MLKVETVNGETCTIGTVEETVEEIDKLWWSHSAKKVKNLSEHLDFDILSVLPDNMKDNLVMHEGYKGAIGGIKWL